MPFEDKLEELERRTRHALAMGGEEKVRRRHDQGKLTARERIDRLLDPGTFSEIGMFAHSGRARHGRKNPGRQQRWVGFGKIDGRRIAIFSNDFTVLAATTSRVASRKEGELKHQAIRRGYPVVYLGEGGGGPHA